MIGEIMATLSPTKNPHVILSEEMPHIDFAPVIRTMVRDMEFSEEDALAQLEAFKQWFSVIPLVEPGKVYTMLKVPVDEVFHACVLNTAFYRSFCDQILGEFLDHTPIDSETIGDLDEGVAYTVNLLEETFGDDLRPELKEWRTFLDQGTYVVSCMQCPDFTQGDMGDTVLTRTQSGARVVH